MASVESTLVSFIVAVYNIEEYIGACIESLLAQTGAAFEILLVDDGSTDKSGVICDRYAEKDRRITVIHQQNAGQSKARNVGLARARGCWISFVDGDDWLDGSMLETLSASLTPQLDILFYSYSSVSGNKTVDHSCGASPRPLSRADFIDIQKDILDTRMKNRAGLNTPVASMCTKVYRRDFLLATSVQCDERLRTAQDLLFNFQVLFRANTGLYIDKPFYNYRMVASSTSNKYRPDRMRYHLILLEELKKTLDVEPDGPLLQDEYQQRIALVAGWFCALDCCHPNNPKPYRERKQDFLAFVAKEPFNTTIAAIPLREFTLQKRLLTFMIRHRAFFGINALLKFRSFLMRKFGLWAYWY